MLAFRIRADGKTNHIILRYRAIFDAWGFVVVGPLCARAISCGAVDFRCRVIDFLREVDERLIIRFVFGFMFDFSVLGTFFVTKSELCLVFSKAIKYPDFCGFVTRAFNYQRSSFFQHSSKNQTQNRFRNKKLAQNGKYAPIKTQKEILKNYHIPSHIDSIVLVEKGNYYYQSSAALKICKHLKGAWKLFYVLILVPKPIRDFIYKIIARNRYKWFGKKESCILPSPEIRKRFLS